MAAGSKEDEREDTSPASEDDVAVSAEASELRRRLLAAGSNDNAQRPPVSALPSGRPARPAPSASVERRSLEEGGRALRATAQFVRRRAPASDELETSTEISGPAPRPRDGAATSADAAEPALAETARPSRMRIMLPFVAGTLLILVALVHRSLDAVFVAHTESLSAVKTSAVRSHPAPSASDAAKRVEHDGQSLRGAAHESAAAEAPSAAPTLSVTNLVPNIGAAPLTASTASKMPVTSLASPADEAARLLGAARSKALAKSKPAVTLSEASRVVEAPAATHAQEPASTSPAPEPAAPAPARPRLVDDGARPGLLD
jgi:hypothetical protein